MHVAMNTRTEFGYIGREIEEKRQRERGGEKDSRKETEGRERRPKKKVEKWEGDRGGNIRGEMEGKRQRRDRGERHRKRDAEKWDNEQ
jgi:hypothetical protein